MISRAHTNTYARGVCAHFQRGEDVCRPYRHRTRTYIYIYDCVKVAGPVDRWLLYARSRVARLDERSFAAVRALNTLYIFTYI